MSADARLPSDFDLTTDELLPVFNDANVDAHRAAKEASTEASGLASQAARLAGVVWITVSANRPRGSAALEMSHTVFWQCQEELNRAFKVHIRQ